MGRGHTGKDRPSSINKNTAPRSPEFSFNSKDRQIQSRLNPSPNSSGSIVQVNTHHFKIGDKLLQTIQQEILL